MFRRLAHLVLGLSLGLVALPTVLQAQPGLVAAAEFRFPRAGDTGPEIVRLQQAIVSRGGSLRGGVTGTFDSATAEALRVVQRQAGLPASGSIDARTAKLLGIGRTVEVVRAATPVVTRATATKSTTAATTSGASRVADATAATSVRVGSRGDRVRGVQNALLANGITILGGVDGVYGRGTQAAVAEFQRRNGIPITGDVDAATATALGIGSTATSTGSSTAAVTPDTGTAGRLPQRGDRSDAVRALQSALITAGIPVAGGADGVFGAATAAAVAAFQGARGLNATGVVDFDTAHALGLSPSLEELGLPRLAAFPMQGRCAFIDDWGAPRSGGRKHEGTDLIGARGLAIYAVTDGVITRVHTGLTLGGNALRLQMADGTYFFYAHLDGFAPGIAPGVPVRAGQVIGYNGSTGNAGGPHLHFEIHPRGGAAINPYPLLKAIDGCERTELLPQG